MINPNDSVSNIMKIALLTNHQHEDNKMKYTWITAALLVAVMGFFSATSQAAPTTGPKPSCPLGQIPVLKNGMWVCNEPHITTTKPAERKGAESKPNCPIGKIAVNKNGTWVCDELNITVDKPAERKGVESKPNCPVGTIAKLEQGFWKCDQLNKAAEPRPQR